MTIRTTRWPIEPHTEIKHLILRRYLEAWFPVLARWNGRISFIDGFAGPGRYDKGEEGSPIIALNALLGHSYFKARPPKCKVSLIFIEPREDRRAALEAELQDLVSSAPLPHWVTYEVKQAKFASVTSTLCDQVENKGHQLPPTFAFIDPFGFSDIPLTIIARIMKHPGCECLITFQYDYINRFLNHPDPAIQAHLDALFGTRAWQDIVQEADPDRRRDAIMDLYRHQLHDQAGAKHVRTFEMINYGNRTEYFLYFGTNSRTGLSKMKEAMWRTAPMSGRVFSDRTDARQPVLFDAPPDVASLRALLQTKFVGKDWVPIAEVEDFVLFDTPYSESIHLKKMTLMPLEQEKIIRVSRPRGKRERPGEYPRGTRILFS